MHSTLLQRGYRKRNGIGYLRWKKFFSFSSIVYTDLRKKNRSEYQDLSRALLNLIRAEFVHVMFKFSAHA